MNREEAKEIIILEKSRELHTYGKTKFVEALDVAIKALEQEPCEDEELDFVQSHKKIKVNLVPCEDAISRERDKNNA